MMGNLLAFYLVLALSTTFHFFIQSMYVEIDWEEVKLHIYWSFFSCTSIYLLIYGYETIIHYLFPLHTVPEGIPILEYV